MSTLEASATVRLENASVAFSGRTILDDATVIVEPGEIHALVGQNGSGKSTIAKVLAGVYVAQSGARLLVGGLEIKLPPKPRDLLQAGIAFVHQDLGLVDELSVADNMTISRLTAARFTRNIDRAEQRSRCREVLDRLGLDLDVTELVGELTAAERTCVAIGRAVLAQHERPGLLVLDEATGSLQSSARAIVHDLMRRLASRGGSVLMVSHNLAEVLEVADRVTVLRDGSVTQSGLSCGELTEPRLVELMLGETADLNLPPRQASTRVEERLVVSGCEGGRVVDASFSVGSGEVVGLTGLEGSGFEDVPYLVSGALEAAGGALTVDGSHRSMTGFGIRDAHKLGIALVPGNRHKQGVAVAESVRHNVSLPQLRTRSRWFFLARAWQDQSAEDVIRGWNVRPPTPTSTVATLSGGNQQKVLLGKWFGGNPRVVVLHEPTQAVDVGARADILRVIHDRAAGGTSILIASVDPTVLAAICDRVLVFREGEIADVLITRNHQEIIDAVYSSTSRGAEPEAPVPDPALARPSERTDQ